MIDKQKVIEALEKLAKDERTFYAGNPKYLKIQYGLQELAEDALTLILQGEEKTQQDKPLRRRQYD